MQPEDYQKDCQQLVSEFSVTVAERYRTSVADIVGDRPICWQPGSGSIIISVSPLDLQQITDNEQQLIQPVLNCAKFISIELGGKIILNFPAQGESTQPKPMLTQEESIISRVRVVPDEDLEREVMSYSGSASILRMKDNKGLYCNKQITLSSGASRNDWVGHNAAQYHIPEELSRYLGALYKELDTEVQYKAPLFDGRIHLFHNRVRFVMYGNELCRLVKTISVEPLN